MGQNSWVRISLLALSLSSVAAVERHFVGPRGVGMAGAVVASTTADQAMAYNAAALGFRSRREDEERAPSNWLGLQISAGAQLRGDFQARLDALQEIEDRLDNADNGDGLTGREVEDYLRLIDGLASLQTDTITADVDANGGMAFVGRQWSLGVLASFDASGFVTNIDLENLALNAASSLANGLINNAEELLGGDPEDYDIRNLNDDQIASLLDAGYSETAIKVLDSQVDMANDDQLELIVEGVVNANLTEVGELETNDTRVTLSSILLMEIPLTYGARLNDYVSIGGTIKAMYGQVGNREVRVFDSDADEFLFTYEGEREGSWQVGFDLSLLVRWRWLHLGLHGRNLNEPEFDRPAGRNVSSKPLEVQRNVVAGLAVDPWSWLTLEVAADLVDYRRLNGSTEWRTLSLAAEVRPWSRWAIRVGGYTNVDSQDRLDEDSALTFGTGYVGRYLEFQIGAALSHETVSYREYQLPKQMRLSLALAAKF